MKLLKLSAFLLLITLSACDQKEPKSDKEGTITFIELGSVRCIPCKKMQKVIKQVEEKYPTQVETIFYDVWTDEGEEAAKDYVFDEIPTQIFLDENGKEFARHVGYFPFEELDEIIKQKLQ